MIISEKFYRWEDGSPGGWYKDDDGTRHDLYSWDEMNRESAFEDAVKKKGEFAWFCYTHNIGTYFYKEEDRSLWLGAESHYDEDHFFFITGIPGLEDKKIAFQLRVSNHKTKHEQWEATHSEGYESINRRIQKRPELKADFCLNLIMNPLGRKSDDYNDNPAINTKVMSLDIPFDYYGKPKEQQEEIDRILSQITNGLRPTITYDKIVSLFGEGEIRTSGPGEYREHNFTDRNNQVFNRGKYYKFLQQKDKKDNAVSSEIPTEFKMDDIPLSDSGEFEFDKRKYYFDYENFVVYPEKTRRGNKYFDKKSPIQVVEHVIKISDKDIMEMVKRVIGLIF